MSNDTHYEPSEPWETEQGWERIIAQSVYQSTIAPRELRAIIEAASEVATLGYRGELIVEAIRKLTRNPWIETAGMFADDPGLLPILKDIYEDRQKSRLADDKEDR